MPATIIPILTATGTRYALISDGATVQVFNFMGAVRCHGRLPSGGAMKLLAIALMLLSILACGPHWQDTPRPHYHNQMPYLPAK